MDQLDLGIVRKISLVRLSSELARSLGGIGKIAVEGEVYRPNTGQRGAGGRVWFTLRDRAAQITVTVPASRAKRARVVSGERVLVTGVLEWVNRWGALQLVAQEVVPTGEGAVAAMIAETRSRLAAEGLLDRPRRAIPLLPRVIGVVCGMDAAVRHDIESVVAARFPGYPVVFREVPVSGPGAVDAVRDAIDDLAQRDGVDVIVLARGGGDVTQLLPFSDEDICRAVVASPVPVVSAIGHERDRPLCDEVADVRCGTPSLAASTVVPDLDALRARIDDARARAVVVCERRVDRARATLDAQRRHLDALSPQRVLERGYAVVRTQATGTVVRDASTVTRGERVAVQVASGHFAAEVTDG